MGDQRLLERGGQAFCSMGTERHAGKKSEARGEAQPHDRDGP